MKLGISKDGKRLFFDSREVKNIEVWTLEYGYGKIVLNLRAFSEGQKWLLDWANSELSKGGCVTYLSEEGPARAFLALRAFCESVEHGYVPEGEE